MFKSLTCSSRDDSSWPWLESWTPRPLCLEVFTPRRDTDPSGFSHDQRITVIRSSSDVSPPRHRVLMFIFDRVRKAKRAASLAADCMAPSSTAHGNGVLEARAVI